MKTNKMHPADAEAIRAIASAKSFSVTIFKGTTHHHIIEFADAIEAGRLMENISGSGRKSMVYAITQEGASIMIPRSLYPLTDHALMEKAMTTIQTNGASALAQTGRRSAAMSAIAALKAGTTPAPDTGKASTTVDLTETKPGVPAFLDATKNKDARDQARARPLPTTAKAAPQSKAAASSVTSEDAMPSRATLNRQISAVSPSKAAAAARKVGKRRERAASPDAIKPIVPLRGPALADFLAAYAKAAKGVLPPVPDFTADTHKPYRDELKMIVALAKAGDLEKLKADRIQPTWNSRTQIVRYRVLAIHAIEVQKHVKHPTVIPGLDKALKAQEAETETPKTKTDAPPAKKRTVSEAAANLRKAKAADKAKAKAKKKK